MCVSFFASGANDIKGPRLFVAKKIIQVSCVPIERVNVRVRYYACRALTSKSSANFSIAWYFCFYPFSDLLLLARVDATGSNEMTKRTLFFGYTDTAANAVSVFVFPPFRLFLLPFLTLPFLLSYSQNTFCPKSIMEPKCGQIVRTIMSSSLCFVVRINGSNE